MTTIINFFLKVIVAPYFSDEPDQDDHADFSYETYEITEIPQHLFGSTETKITNVSI